MGSHHGKYADGTEYTHDGTTGVFTYYHRMSGRTVAFTTSDDSKTTWMFSDQISSTSDTRDENGVHNVQRYTPWGETRTDGNLVTDHTYTGQIEDTSTGLRFYNARYQDPTIGRFISADSIVPSVANGQDYNRYSYVANNPILLADPSGHCPPNRGCEHYNEIGSETGKQVGPEPSARQLVNSTSGSSGTGSDLLAETEGYSDVLEYIVAEMNQNTEGYQDPLFGDIVNGLFKYPGGQEWDHKPMIRERWGDRFVIEIDGQFWEVSHDIWSNIHYGYVNRSEWGIVPDRVWNGCAARCPSALVGENNALDIFYMESGNELYEETGGDLTVDAFKEFLQFEMWTWSIQDDPSRPNPVARALDG